MLPLIIVLLLCVARQIRTLPLPPKFWCSDPDVAWENCSKVSGTVRMMEEIDHLPMKMPHWWETLKPYERQCPSCTPIWLLCPVEDTGSWDGGSVLRLGSRVMLEVINRQQWLLPGYELMCEYYNNDCNANNALLIVSGRSNLNHGKYVGIGGTGCSGVSNILSQVTWTYNLPIMSWASGAPDLSVRSKHRNFFRTVVPHTALTYAWVSVYKICGWKKIVVIFAEEARFRGHFNMHTDEIKKSGMETAFSAQILDPILYTDGIMTTIKAARFRIIQALTFENTWRAMLCSAYSLGMRGLIWLVFGVYSKGWYNTLDNPMLTRWNCATAELRLMADGAIYAMTVMWTQHMNMPLYCDRDKVMTPQSYRDNLTVLALDELQGGGDVNSEVNLRGGHSPKSGFYPAPADGVCLYAQTLSALLGLHPAGKKATNGKTYSLAEIASRSYEVYDQFNALLQTIEFAGVGSSKLAFDCKNTRSYGSFCDDRCRNADNCTGDLNGLSEIYQFFKDGKVGEFDSYAENSEFPIRMVYDRTLELAATDDVGRNAAYTWFTPLQFAYGKYWPTDAFSSTSTCVHGYHKKESTNTNYYCVPDDQLPDCPPGQVLTGEACADCDVDSYWSVFQGQSVCQACPTGRMQPITAQTMCNACDVGKFSNQTATACVDCAPGFYAATLGASACSPCSAGKIADLSGQTSCMDCLIGTYSNRQGQSTCSGCGLAKTTLRHLQVAGAYQWILVSGSSTDSDCMCAYGSRSDGDVCVGCKQEGLVCEGDTRIEYGYYAATDYLVFKCSPANRCKGGAAGQTCETGRTAIACSECQSGKRPSGGTGKCIDCNKSDMAPFFLVVIVTVFIVLVTYYVIDSECLASSSHSMLLAGISFGQLIAILQILSVISDLFVDFPEPLRSLLGMMSLFVLDLEKLGFDCVAYVPPVTRFAFKIVAMLSMGTVVLVIHCLSVVFRHGGDFKARLPSCIAIVGTVFTVFFIAIVSILIAPMQCNEHPSSKLTVGSYGSVLCWESEEHTIMVVLSVFALLFPITYVVLCVIIVAQYPRKIRAMDTRYLQAYSFLFVRVNPESYWYGLVIIGRSLCFAVIRVISNAAMQIVMLQILLMPLLIISISCAPWRTKVNNCIDIASNVVIVLFLTLISLFVTDIDRMAVAWCCTIGLSGFLVIFPIGITYGLAVSYRPTAKMYQFFLCHHKRGAGAYTRMLKMYLTEQPKVRRKVFVDCDDLSNLDTLFDTVGHQVDCLVVIGSNSVLLRPWCVGEIVTAHTKNVDMKMIQLPEFRKIQSDMIENYSPEMEGMCALAKSGISIAMIKDALRFLERLHKIEVPHIVNHEIATALASKLAAGYENSVIIEGCEEDGTPTQVSAIILCDTGVIEALAAALVLRKMLTSFNVHMAIVYQPCEIEVSRAIALFSAGCLERVHLPTLLVQAARQELGVVPLLIEEDFRIPTAQAIKDLILNSPVSKFEATPGEFAAVVAMIFVEIAKSFPVSMDSEELLKAHAKIIAVRVRSGLSAVQKTAAGGSSSRIFDADATMDTTCDFSPPSRDSSVDRNASSMGGSPFGIIISTRNVTRPEAVRASLADFDFLNGSTDTNFGCSSVDTNVCRQKDANGTELKNSNGSIYITTCPVDIDFYDCKEPEVGLVVDGEHDKLSPQRMLLQNRS